MERVSLGTTTRQTRHPAFFISTFGWPLYSSLALMHAIGLLVVAVVSRPGKPSLLAYYSAPFGRCPFLALVHSALPSSFWKAPLE